MRYISCKLDDLKKIVLPIGYEGENEHTRVQVDAGEVFKEYPAAVPTLKVHGPTGAIYPAEVTRDGKNVIWDIKASDCAADGSGEAQFTFTLNNVIVKSCIAKIKVYRSIVGGSTPPDPVQDWLDEAQDVLNDLEAAEVHQPMIGVDGYWYTWDQENEEYTKTETKAQGEDGQQGPAGQDGAPGQDATPALITVNYSDLTFPVAKDTQCYHDGLLYYAKQDIQTSEAWTAAHWQQTTVEEQQRLLKSGYHGLEDANTILNNDISQLKTNGFTTLYPDWETGKWGINGKETDSGERRTKTLLHLPKGTYTINTSIACSVWAYPTSGGTNGVDLLWKQTGEKTFTVTNKEYIAFVVDWSAEGNPTTEMYAVVPSAISDVIAQATATETKATENRTLIDNRTEYDDGIYTAVIDNVTLEANKGIGSGVEIGSVLALTNDNYSQVMTAPVQPGRKYRIKAKIYNNYYLAHFTDANNVLIQKYVKNTSGSTYTYIDEVVTAPAGATKLYIAAMKNPPILLDVFNPYTIKDIINIKTDARGSFCIMEFNVGDWYEGRWRDADNSGAIPADETIYTNYMNLFNGIFGRYKPDIAMINEDAQEMCLNRHSDSRALIGKYFRNMTRARMQAQTHTDVFNTIASAFPVFDVSTHYYTNTESNTTRNWLKGYTYINGKKVCLICTHLSPTLETAKLNATELLAAIQAEDPDYLICCGDFNYDTNVAEIAAFETAGYTISRGNTVYDGHTYGPGDLIVTTSNITVKSVFCDTQKIDASFVEYIDHLPTIAYLEIY